MFNRISCHRSTCSYHGADAIADLTESWADDRADVRDAYAVLGSDARAEHAGALVEADICTHAAGAHACADLAEKLEANAGTSAGAGDVRACSSAYGAHDRADAGALVYGATYGRAERRADETYG